MVEHRDLLPFRYNVGAAALAFVLAAVAVFFVSYGLAIGFTFGAIFLYACAHNFHRLAHVRLAWPLELAANPLRGEWEVFRFATIVALVLAGLVASLSSITIYIFELKKDLAISEASQDTRHLGADQKDRIRRDMALNPTENYYFQVNSLNSCDECEKFAEEIRAFINTLPGWKAGGGPLMFPSPEAWHHGLWLFAADKDAHTPPVEKVAKSFADAGLPLEQTSDGVNPGLFVVFIGRAH
jgi:hypothetical protein